MNFIQYLPNNIYFEKSEEKLQKLNRATLKPGGWPTKTQLLIQKYNWVAGKHSIVFEKPFNLVKSSSLHICGLEKINSKGKLSGEAEEILLSLEKRAHSTVFVWRETIDTVLF